MTTETKQADEDERRRKAAIASRAQAAAHKALRRDNPDEYRRLYAHFKGRLERGEKVDV